jgi:hypothetical protein
MTHEFCDHCPGCRPAIIDWDSGKPFPDDSPLMLAINRIWDKETTYEERKAFIDVTVHNSRRSSDRRLARRVAAKFETAISQRASGPRAD